MADYLDDRGLPQRLDSFDLSLLDDEPGFLSRWLAAWKAKLSLLLG